MRKNRLNFEGLVIVDDAGFVVSACGDGAPQGAIKSLDKKHPVHGPHRAVDLRVLGAVAQEFLDMTQCGCGHPLPDHYDGCPAMGMQDLRDALEAQMK